MDYDGLSFYAMSETISAGNTLTANALVDGVFGKKIKENTDKIKENTTKIDYSLDIDYYNSINPATITENASIDKSNGSLIEGNQYNDATGYILLKKNTLYYVHGIFLTNFYAFYDTNDIIEKHSDTNHTATNE